MNCPKCEQQLEYHGEGYNAETSCFCPWGERIEDIGPHFYCRECEVKLVLQWHLRKPEVVV